VARAAPPERIPYAIAALFLGLGLLSASFAYHQYDVVDCFLAWSRASGGTSPAAVYTPGAGADDCDYPPLVPYWLTVVEAARRATGAPPVGFLTLALLKLPNLLAAVAGVPLCLRGLREVFGAAAARGAAVLFASSPAFFVNGLWGQFDVLLAVLVLAAFVAVINDRPVAAGALIGLALATKLLAVVALPLLAVALLARGGLRDATRAAGAAVVVAGLVALPLVVGGAGPAVARAYTGAVHYYPYRTAEAYNGWYVLDRYDVRVRGIPYPVARRDDRPALGPITYQQIGLGLMGVATAFFLALARNRGGPRSLFAIATLQAFAFFMLPTQVHQRYVVLAIAFAAVLAAVSRPGLGLFLGLSLTATLNQALDLARALPGATVAATTRGLTAETFALPVPVWRDLGALIGLANLALFVWAMVVFSRQRPGIWTRVEPIT
jgi:4-amino-4-deoxy-L-arabinose transferase-like glycosyltransferase